MSGNDYLPSRFSEVIWRLEVGLEPLDALRRGRVTAPLRVIGDRPLPDESVLRALENGRRDITDVMPSVQRRNTCRFALVYTPDSYDMEDPFVYLRIIEGSGQFGPRRYVPRRLKIPLIDPATLDDDDALPAAARIRRPWLYPGADYPLSESCTAVRGRVERDGEPMRWARVTAIRRDANIVVGRAHGDDRGEFLLVLTARAAPPGVLTPSISVRIRVRGPATVPEAESDLIAATDPHWDLPLEELPLNSTGDDAITRGTHRPTGYSKVAERDVSVRLGRVQSEQTPFTIS